ncbi:MAG: dihydrolipoamide succinyltransferase, partial [Betaproteobacteria bacterium]
MSLEIKIPTVGESITEVTISEWFKQDGDYVELDEIICELESDKASFELNAEAAGILKIKAQEGDTLEIGAVICEIDTNAKVESASNRVEQEQKTDPPSAPKSSDSVKEVLEMRVPEVGESITEVTLSSWIKNDGDYVELDENIADIDSDKASFELPAEANGTLRIVA